MRHRPAGPAGAALGVVRIDAGGRDLDQHLAVPGTRRLDLAVDENVGGGPGALVVDSAHGQPRIRRSICSTCAIGVCGRMPWPRLKISGPCAEILQDVVDRAIERGAAGEQRQRIEIALHGDAALHVLAHEGRLGHPVDAHRVDRHAVEIACERGAGAARKADDLRAGHLAAHVLDHAPHRRDAPALELGGRQHAGPGVEDLHRVGAGAAAAPPGSATTPRPGCRSCGRTLAARDTPSARAGAWSGVPRPATM